MTGSKRSMKYILIVIAAAMAAAVTLVFAAKHSATAETPEHQSHDDGDWQAWTDTTNLPTEGTYYLSDNVELSNTITLTGELTLCLNGFTISGSMTKFNVTSGHTLNICDCTEDAEHIGKLTGTTNASAVIVDGGTLNLYGGKITGNTISSGANTGSGVAVLDKGTFKMYGGEISNNTVSSTTSQGGGGVYLENGSIFEMYEGSVIKGNIAKNGGGVYVNSSEAKFTMYGGTISNNHSTNITSSDGGGGVFVTNGAAFAMSGKSEIKDNDAKNLGGGVYLYGMNSSFTMSGDSKITNNTATGNMGGGVHIQGFSTSFPTIFTMDGGEISNNTSSEYGGGVSLNGGGATFIMKGGTIGGASEALGNSTLNGGGVCVSRFRIYNVRRNDFEQQIY